MSERKILDYLDKDLHHQSQELERVPDIFDQIIDENKASP